MYTVMNPAGSLSTHGQATTFVNKSTQSPGLTQCYGYETQRQWPSAPSHPSRELLRDEGHHFQQFERTFQANGQLMGSSMASNPRFLDEEEERYVKGVF